MEINISEKLRMYKVWINQKRDFHVHCNYNDHSANDLTISNVIIEAQKKGLETLAFTEHVRKTSDWIPKYLNEIESAKSKVSNNKLDIIAGFEAKILRDGSIDCPEDYADKYFLIASFHTTYNDKQVWLHALELVIQNSSVDVIGHIAAEPSFTLDQGEIERLAHLIVKNRKTIEINAKYHRPSTEWLTTFKDAGVDFHLGSDAHSLPEVGDFKRIRDLISLAEA